MGIHIDIAGGIVDLPANWFLYQQPSRNNNHNIKTQQDRGIPFSQSDLILKKTASEMWSTVLILFAGVLLHPSLATKDVRYGGPVIFSFPCNENPRFLTQEFQIPVKNRSAGPWKGIFYADEWPSSDYMKLDIVLDREALVEVNPQAVHLIDLDSSATPEGLMKSFRLTTHPKRISRIEFKVQGVNGEFPSVLSMVANGIVLCDNNGRNSNADLIQSLSEGQSTNSGGLSAAEKRRRGCGVRHPISDTMDELIDWPWRISLLAKETETNEWSVICGGTLIALNRVLTGKSFSGSFTTDQR